MLGRLDELRSVPGGWRGPWSLMASPRLVSAEVDMFCSKCGNQNPDDARFCYRCGQRMIEPIERPTATAQTKRNPSTNVYEAPTLAQARALLEAGRLSSSEEAFHRVIASGRDVVESNYYLGVIQLHRGDEDVAADFFAEALKHDPCHANSL